MPNNNPLPGRLSSQFRNVFHASKAAPEEFMSAPTLHVGTLNSAVDRATNIDDWELENPLPGMEDDFSPQDIHKITISEHMTAHPKILSDKEANIANVRYLKKAGHFVPGSLRDTAKGFSQDITYQGARDIVSAAKSLGRNSVVAYRNESEDPGSISMIVPSPHFNARVTGVLRGTDREEIQAGLKDFDPAKDIKKVRGPKKDPHKQEVLPMDYSGLQESEISRMMKRLGF
jgi:hypothetical protein